MTRTFITCPTCHGDGIVEGPPTLKDALQLANRLYSAPSGLLETIVPLYRDGKAYDWLVVGTLAGTAYVFNVSRGMPDVLLAYEEYDSAWT
jgi:hypothetical protein